MKLNQIVKDAQSSGKPVFSFEFFPPKSQEGEESLFRALSELRSLEPSYVSVTCGAGGSTRDRTLSVVKQIRERFGLEAMAHFTCVDSSIEDLRSSLTQMSDAGIDNVLALRGDPPEGAERFVANANGLGYASELAELISSEYEFSIAGACYPEGHPEAESLDVDIEHLKKKVDAGVEVLITQLFFDNAYYFDFVNRVRSAGIEVPILPGIMPVTNVDQLKRFTSICGASIPPKFLQALEAQREDPEAVLQLGVAYATLQCSELLASGALGVHFYTLNRSPATRAIVSALKLLQPWSSKLDPAVAARS